jgi:hypothetical protein
MKRNLLLISLFLFLALALQANHQPVQSPNLRNSVKKAFPASSGYYAGCRQLLMVPFKSGPILDGTNSFSIRNQWFASKRWNSHKNRLKI